MNPEKSAPVAPAQENDERQALDAMMDEVIAQNLPALKELAK